MRWMHRAHARGEEVCCCGFWTSWDNMVTTADQDSLGRVRGRHGRKLGYRTQMERCGKPYVRASRPQEGCYYYTTTTTLLGWLFKKNNLVRSPLEDRATKLTRSKEKEHSRAFDACETKRCYNQLSTPLRKGGTCRKCGKISHQEDNIQYPRNTDQEEEKESSFYLLFLIVFKLRNLVRTEHPMTRI